MCIYTCSSEPRRNVMRTQIALSVAASIPLMLGATGAFAGDTQFNSPPPARAQQPQPLLSRAAHAVKVGLAQTSAGSVSNLWIYPTGDDTTVLAQYIVTTQGPSSIVPNSQAHFELLKMKGERIVE